jgi:RNA polymerase primary sigma factor
VSWWIRQAVTRAVANDGRMIRLPVHLGERLRQAAHAEQRLRADLGREPTLAEVALRVGLGPERLHALRLAASAAASLDAPAHPTTNLTRGEVIADDAAGPEDQAVTELDELAVLIAMALERLSPREREVVRLRYGLGRSETWNLAQIGARLGVTRERARQLEEQALRKLRHDLLLQRALVDFHTA